jgi:Flp pilus assembly protein TadG
MLSPFRHLRNDERGMSLVFISVGFMSFMAATTLAIDVGMFMTARNQAQNSADAAALSGAVALVRNSFTDRSASGPVVQSAIRTAEQNTIFGEDVSVTAADVTFPAGPGGQFNRVRVQVYRTVERQNAVPTLVGAFFGVPTVDITAAATAEVSPANAMTCVKPFMIPDKWIEKQTPEWDPGDSYDKYAAKNKGGLLANPDVYIGSGASYTGTPTRMTSGVSWCCAPPPVTRSTRAFTTRGRCPAIPRATSTARTSRTAIRPGLSVAQSSSRNPARCKGRRSRVSKS